MKRRSIIAALLLLLVLATGVPAGAAPLSLPGWAQSITAWLTAFWAPAPAPVPVVATSAGDEALICHNSSGAIVPCGPIAQVDASGCIDPNGVRVPCNPGH